MEFGATSNPRIQRRDSKLSLQTNKESENPKNLQRRLLSIRADSVQEERTEWFLDQRIPAEEFSLLIGREGLGKSTLTLDLLSQATQGTLDGYLLGIPVNVAIIANEDSLQKTLKPRITVAGADLEKVFFIGSETIFGGYNGSIVVPNDLEQLREVIERNEIRALVIDPLVGILNEKIDTHNYASTKQGLQHLNEFARSSQVTLIAVTHENKSNAEDFSRRVNGSVAFTTVPRAVLGVVKDPNDETGETLLFGNSKVSNGRLNFPAMRFHISGAMTPAGIESSKVEWLPNADSSFLDLTSDSRSPEQRYEENELQTFLRNLMESHGGVIAAKEALEELQKNNLGKSQSGLDKAKRILKIKSTMQNNSWIWHWSDLHKDSLDSRILPTTATQSRIQPADSPKMDSELRKKLDAPKPPCSVCGEALGVADLAVNATAHGLCE